MNISRPLVCMTESWVSLACFLERNEPVTQPKAAHSTSRMPHPESVPEAVLIDAEKDEARKAGPESKQLH